MSRRGSHSSSNGTAKVSYTTRQAAVEAAVRRRAQGWSVLVYECTDKRGERRAQAPEVTLSWPHWHIGTDRRTSATKGQRFHWEWDDLLGKRVVGCMWAENSRGGKRVVLQRAEKALLRGKS